jgi:hypothetical protein
VIDRPDLHLDETETLCVLSRIASGKVVRETQFERFDVFCKRWLSLRIGKSSLVLRLLTLDLLHILGSKLESERFDVLFKMLSKEHDIAVRIAPTWQRP